MSYLYTKYSWPSYIFFLSETTARFHVFCASRTFRRNLWFRNTKFSEVNLPVRLAGHVFNRGRQSRGETATSNDSLLGAGVSITVPAIFSNLSNLINVVLCRQVDIKNSSLNSFQVEVTVNNGFTACLFLQLSKSIFLS